MQPLVFLVDVDNTLLDNDTIKADWDKQLKVELGPKLTARFWEMYEQVRKERGIVDIPLALARLRDYFCNQIGWRSFSKVNASSLFSLTL